MPQRPAHHAPAAQAEGESLPLVTGVGDDGSPRLAAQRRKIDGLLGGARVAAQRRKIDGLVGAASIEPGTASPADADIASRTLGGKLRADEVRMPARQMDLSSTTVMPLAAQLQRVSRSGPPPLAEALRSGAAQVDGGRLQVPGLQPASPRQLGSAVEAFGARRAQLQVRGNQYRVIGLLNPWLKIVEGVIRGVEKAWNKKGLTKEWIWRNVDTLRSERLDPNDLMGKPYVIEDDDETGVEVSQSPQTASTSSSSSYVPQSSPLPSINIVNDSATPSIPTGSVKQEQKCEEVDTPDSMSEHSATPKKSLRPDISLKGSFKPESSVPETVFEESAVIKEWKGLSTKDFYAKARGLLKAARDTKSDDHAASKLKLDQLIAASCKSDTVKELIHGYVRVAARKAEGAASGTGLDELFKTSETMRYLERSYRAPEGTVPVATFRGEEFDWMDAQQQIRLSTEMIIWAHDLVDQVSGHTGTFQRKYKNKWMTTKQSLMHEIRDEKINRRSNPANAIVEAIGVHLRLTANVESFTEDVYKTSEDAKEALMVDGHPLSESYDHVLEQLAEHRDTLKNFMAFIEQNSEGQVGASPMKPSIPMSPMSNTKTPQVVDMKKGAIKDNPLPNLSTQWRMTHPNEPINIPQQPVDPRIAKARKELKEALGPTIAARIHSAAKRKLKQPLMNADDNAEAGEVMIDVYIERAQDYVNEDGVAQIIKDLKQSKK
ncbi:hypothetical protein [Roseateles chitosanitabidus]|uniref:hypothetical protein n=1 Tax=Roseateles chitosanitabidus TaxID=65048 RepID=UPI0008333C0C|nr:hypothetical protein [Roseateles chitosanitabidus]